MLHYVKMKEKKKCEHKFKALYCRRKLKEGDQQAWFKLKEYVICDKCNKIVKKEVKISSV